MEDRWYGRRHGAAHRHQSRPGELPAIRPAWAAGCREFTELNGQIFFLAFEPNTGVELWALRSGAQVVTNCGNGILEPGEQCDDGNVSDGDCCSSACRFEPAGTACADDGNLCTADQCDGAGEQQTPSDTFPDRKSTRLNSSHTVISYAVFCLKKKK